MEIVVLIICAVIIVAGIVLIIWLLRNRYDNSNVVIHGGMDTGTQKNGTESGSLFIGVSNELGTSVLNGKNRRRTYRFYLIDMEKGEKYDIQFRENIGIGRAENVRGIERFLTIHNDMRISGYHCRIYAFNSQIYIEDTGSKKHTYVNQEQVTRPHVLRNNDVIRVGDTRLTVKF